MTYLELQQQNELLKDILKQALSELGDNHPWCCAAASALVPLQDGTFEIGEGGKCDCWMKRATDALAPKNEVIQKGISRLDGEECGTCKHSSTFHSNHVGICTKVDCECMKFAPTGRPNTQAR